MAMPLEQPILCPSLIGRQQHIGVLHHLLEQTLGGTGQVIVISGEAGIGKSRLVMEVKTSAAPAGTRILQGSFFEPDRSLPYAALLDLFRRAFAASSPAEIKRDVGAAGPELVKLLPELALRLPGLAPTPLMEPEQEKRRLIETLTQFFVQLSATQPLLVVIEDLHWSDETSLEFLLSLSRRIAGHPIMLLMTYRSDEVHANLRHLLAQLDRERLASEIPLGPLDKSEVEAMIRTIFRLQRPPSADVLDALYPLTEGNPFFLEETLKALVVAGDVFTRNGAWERKPSGEFHIPRSIHDAVQRRVQQLTPAVRELLELASVAGQRFDIALLQALTNTNERALLQLVKELIAAQLVVEASAEQIAFRHALTRQAIYSELLARERRSLHQSIAETIEHLYAASLDAHLGELAYHSYEAGQWEKAFNYAQQIGERSLALYAPRAAIEQFTRALDAARRLSYAPSPALLHRRGQAYETLGDFEHARADYEAALHAAPEQHDHAAEWQALLDLGLLWAGRDYTQTGVYYLQAFDLAQTIGDPIRLAQSQNRLGNWHLNVDQPLEAIRYHQEALALFQAADHQQGIAQTLDLLGMANLLNSARLESAACLERAVALWREIGDRQWLSSSLATLALCGVCYHTDKAIPATHCKPASAEEALQLAREIGWYPGEAYALMVRASCLGPRGEYARALEVAGRGLALADEIEHRQWATASRWALGAILLDLLALEQAREVLEQGWKLATAIGSRHWIGCIAGLLTTTYLAQGSLTQAEAVLAEVLPSGTPFQTMGQRAAWCGRAELALAQHRPEEALHIAETLTASTPNVSEERKPVRVARLLGAALAVLQQSEEAGAVLSSAYRLAKEQGWRSLFWRLGIDLGQLYRSERRHAEAEQCFAQARSEVESLAAGVPDDLLRATFLERASAILPPPRPALLRRGQANDYAGLTARELEVARLVAQGKSNRAIAETLVVSERTAESHVTNILLKLDLTSRAQIAAWATGKGLMAPSEAGG
ncbi:MAG TPA: AAA family ATPase [Ktedonobacterales bacterium]